MAMNKRPWVLGFIVLAVTGLVCPLRGDARDDLSRANSDYNALKSHYDDAKSKLEKYLDESVKLRAMDKDQLNDLITQMCRLDQKRDDDEVDRLDKELKDKVVERVKREYDHTVDDGSRVFDDLGHLESEAKSARDRARDLESKDEVKDGAQRLRQDIEQTQDAIAKLFERINSDRQTLERVKEGSMNGANNPTIRARMEYGKEMHKKLQSDRGCDEKEVVLSSGRPDCIKFDSDDCKIIEFKPDSYSTSQAESEASNYLRDVREKFKTDDRAKKCKQDSDGPIFRAVGETYPRCQAP